MKSFIQLFFFNAVIFLLMSCQNKESNSLLKSELVIANSIETESSGNLAAFLSYIGASHSELEAMETEKILEKYKNVRALHENNFYSKAARIRLIRVIVLREDYKTEAIPYLLGELESFRGGVYPKELYLLLKEAKRRNAIKLGDIKMIAKRQYDKAKSNFGEWQRVSNLDPASPALLIEMHGNESIINGLKNSAQEKLLYAEKLKEFFINL